MPVRARRVGPREQHRMFPSRPRLAYLAPPAWPVGSAVTDSLPGSPSSAGSASSATRAVALLLPRLDKPLRPYPHQISLT